MSKTVARFRIREGVERWIKARGAALRLKDGVDLDDPRTLEELSLAEDWAVDGDVRPWDSEDVKDESQFMLYPNFDSFDACDNVCIKTQESALALGVYADFKRNDKEYFDIPRSFNDEFLKLNRTGANLMMHCSGQFCVGIRTDFDEDDDDECGDEPKYFSYYRDVIRLKNVELTPEILDNMWEECGRAMGIRMKEMQMLFEGNSVDQVLSCSCHNWKF